MAGGEPEGTGGGAGRAGGGAGAPPASTTNTTGDIGRAPGPTITCCHLRAQPIDLPDAPPQEPGCFSC
ncbi:hypothetical protein, partial [Streptomyces sp. SP17BM10]|uniref:hypothetical protein n=1 Tax=Streptomyces sp. SP17BM10 TaxID=3002530 RepID=UPI002E793A79